MIVLDAGTGIRELGMALPPGLKRVDVLLSHLHMDHIQGLGFFAAIYNPNIEVHIWGPASISLTLPTRLKRYLSPPLFPVHMRDLPCKLFIHDGSQMDEEIGEFIVSSRMVCHPGPTVGYRVSGRDGTVVYLPDHEPILGASQFLQERGWISGMGVAEGADLLIHDSQYTDEEYLPRIGWGHSSMRQALQFAALAAVQKFVPFHHDPTHRDDDLDRMYENILAEVKPRFPVAPAREGDEIIVRKS